MLSATMMAAKPYNKVRTELQNLRGIRGNSLPQPLIEKLVSLSEATGFTFSTCSIQNERFFRQNARAMRFYDHTGTEFNFSEAGRLLRRNQTFAGVALFPDRKIARVYVHFAYT